MADCWTHSLSDGLTDGLTHYYLQSKPRLQIIGLLDYYQYSLYILSCIRFICRVECTFSRKVQKSLTRFCFIAIHFAGSHSIRHMVHFALTSKQTTQEKQHSTNSTSLGFLDRTSKYHELLSFDVVAKYQNMANKKQKSWTVLFLSKSDTCIDV